MTDIVQMTFIALRLILFLVTPINTRLAGVCDWIIMSERLLILGKCWGNVSIDTAIVSNWFIITDRLYSAIGVEWSSSIYWVLLYIFAPVDLTAEDYNNILIIIYIFCTIY